jgi:hypothetical protein
MKHLALRSVISVAGLAIIAGTAHGSQPQDVVTSDSSGNTAMGTNALYNLTSGSLNNTAVGESALILNTSGQFNTGLGALALFFNESGSDNTAVGAGTLEQNTTGSENSALGMETLNNNTTGSYNTAIGIQALYSNTTGDYNTATGMNALFSNTTGIHNSATGYETLYSNTTGTENTGFGYESLYYNSTGKQNTAFGNEALYSNTSGANNIALGFHAGINLTTGSNDIDIGSAGASGESNVIRIGTAGTQTEAYIAGIANTKVTGSAVYITSSGKLGTLASAERYKTAIAPMGSVTEKLMRLRPVTFHLKSEPDGAVQYGLIAEEVDKVYPELAIHDDEGMLSGVRYDELAPMLLNEFQKQQKQMIAQNEHAASLEVEVRVLNEQLATQSAQLTRTQAQVAELIDLKKELQAAILDLHSKDGLVAQRRED